MLARFYNFPKKANSTKRPGIPPKYEKDIVLKNPTSAFNPSFHVSFFDTDINYVYIPKFDRYYFIDDIVSLGNGRSEIQTNEDVLATWKGTILSSYQYVVRSASTQNTAILDTAYPVTSDLSHTTSLPGNTSYWTTTGFIIIGVAGKLSATGLNYYALNYAALVSLMFYLTDTATYHISTSELSEGLQKALINPINYIKTCHYIPLSFADFKLGAHNISLVNNLNVGGWSIPMDGNAECYSLNALINMTKSIDLGIPKHPQATTRGGYLNCAPYSDYKLIFEPFGVIPISATELNEANKLNVLTKTDLQTGDTYLYVNRYESDGHKIAGYNVTKAYSNVAIPLPLTQITQNILGAGMSAIGAVGGVITSLLTFNPVGAIQSVEYGVGSMAQDLAPTAVVQGKPGSTIMLDEIPRLDARFANIAPEDNEHIGRAVCQRKLLNTLLGFTMCQNAELNIEATSTEHNAIISYLNTGFYIE